MGIQEKFEGHWLGTLLVVAVIVAGGTWAVLNEVLVRPRDEEFARLQRRLEELEANEKIIHTAPELRLTDSSKRQGSIQPQGVNMETAPAGKQIFSPSGAISEGLGTPHQPTTTPEGVRYPGQRTQSPGQQLPGATTLTSQDERVLAEFLLNIPDGARVTILFEEDGQQVENANTLLEMKVVESGRLTLITRSRLHPPLFEEKDLISFLGDKRANNFSVSHVSHVIFVSRDSTHSVLRLFDAREAKMLATANINLTTAGNRPSPQRSTNRPPNPRPQADG